MIKDRWSRANTRSDNDSLVSIILSFTEVESEEPREWPFSFLFLFLLFLFLLSSPSSSSFFNTQKYPIIHGTANIGFLNFILSYTFSQKILLLTKYNRSLGKQPMNFETFAKNLLANRIHLIGNRLTKYRSFSYFNKYLIDVRSVNNRIKVIR